MQNIAAELGETPFTTATGGFCILVWFVLWTRQTGVQNVAFNYPRVVEHGEYWRLLTSVYSHLSTAHIVSNMVSLWNLRVIEVLIGTLEYMRLTLMLVVLSTLFETLAYHVMLHRLGHGAIRNTWVLGYSG